MRQRSVKQKNDSNFIMLTNIIIFVIMHLHDSIYKAFMNYHNYKMENGLVVTRVWKGGEKDMDVTIKG